MSAVSRADGLEHMRQWTAALRSDGYRQVTGTLAKQADPSDTVRYCCLGVGCVVAGVPHKTYGSDTEDFPETSEVRHLFGESEQDDLPPREFIEWLGIEADAQNGDLELDIPPWDGDTENPEHPWCDRDGQPLRPLLSAAHLNDDLHLTFAQIADMVDYFGIAGTA